MEDFVFLEDARDEYSFAALKHKIPQVRCFYISSSLSSAINNNYSPKWRWLVLDICRGREAAR